MDNMPNISDAGLYTDFNHLTRLRADARSQAGTVQSDKAAKEVAKQFESLFLQMMLKSMRDASAIGESTESDQTKFYQEMFDKQIALDLSNNNNGKGIGLARMLEKEISGSSGENVSQLTATDGIDLIRKQINRSTVSIQQQHQFSNSSVVDRSK